MKEVVPNQDRLAWLKSLQLGEGAHDDPSKGACVMEAVAYVAGEPFSDHPACASKVITELCVRLNDRWDTKRRQKLKPFVRRIAGTAAPREIERKRAFMCADWACRELLPLVFEKHPKESLRPWAEKLRALAPVVDSKTAEKARDLAREARSTAYAAAYADADAYAAAAYAAADAYAAAAAAAAALRTKADASVLALLDRLISLQ